MAVKKFKLKHLSSGKIHYLDFHAYNYCLKSDSWGKCMNEVKNKEETKQEKSRERINFEDFVVKDKVKK